MCSRVVSIPGPKPTKPFLPLTANAGRVIDDRDIAERKAFLELGPEESMRLGSRHALIESARDVFTEAFQIHMPSLRRLMSDATSLNGLRASLLTYFSRLTSTGLNSIPSHDDRQTAGTATSGAPLVLLVAMIGPFMATSPCRAHARKQRPYGQVVDDDRLHQPDPEIQTMHFVDMWIIHLMRRALFG